MPSPTTSGLSQFCLVIGSQSPLGIGGRYAPRQLRSGGREDHPLPDAGLAAVREFYAADCGGGDTAEEVARAIAPRTEHGTGTSERDPGWMYEHYAGLRQGIHLRPERDVAFRTQTGQHQRGSQLDCEAAADDVGGSVADGRLLLLAPIAFVLPL